MKVSLFVGALALAAALSTAPALADDPNDPAMRTTEARARDRAIIRQLNLQQLAYVQQRDAQYAQGWKAYRDAHPRETDSVTRRRR